MTDVVKEPYSAFDQWKAKANRQQEVKGKVSLDGLVIPMIHSDSVLASRDDGTEHFFEQSTIPRLYLSTHYEHLALEGVDAYWTPKSVDEHTPYPEFHSTTVIDNLTYHVISTGKLHEAGVPVTHELAYIFAAVEELFRTRGAYLHPGDERLLIHLPTDQHLLTELAKFDAVKHGLYSIASPEGYHEFPGIITTSPSVRKWSSTDDEMNLLRFSNSMTIASLSGIGSFYTIPYDVFSKKGASVKACRLARSIPYLLWEEAKLLPSTYLSSAAIVAELCDTIYDGAWQEYERIEALGGITSWFDRQEDIALCRSSRERMVNYVMNGKLPIVGTTNYRNKEPKMPRTSPEKRRLVEELETWQWTFRDVTFSVSDEIDASAKREITTTLTRMGLLQATSTRGNVHIVTFQNEEIAYTINHRLYTATTTSVQQLVQSIAQHVN